MNAERVQEYYDMLKSFYKKTDSDWTDKARSFRTVAEQFYKEITGTQGTFAEALKEFYSWNKFQDVSRDYYKVQKEMAYTLREALNAVVHQNERIDKDMCAKYYRAIVQLMYFATSVYPDEATRVFIGVEHIDELSGLNDEQKDAVLCDAQIIYVNAGPGTGKTHLLVNKLLHYINTSTSLEKIVALSYTNTAASELGDKFHKAAFENGLSKPYEFYNGTLHSFCFKMMKSFFSTIGKEFNYIIIDDADIEDLTEEILIQSDFRYSRDAIKECLHSRLQSTDPKLGEIIDKIKSAYKIISIDDILSIFINLLKKDQFCDWCRRQVTILVIDEAQDLSKRNYRIFELLLGAIPEMKLFLVGDPRQSIFGFIGGAHENLVEFLEQHNNSVRQNLTGTYRCPQSICNYVNKFSFRDCDNIPLVTIGDNTGKVMVSPFNTMNNEASGVINIVRRINDLNNTAVLCQNLKYLETFFSLLRKEKIPYKVFGGQKFVKRHIRIFNHLLRIIENENNYSIKAINKAYKINYARIPGKNETERFFNTEGGMFLKDIKEDIERKAHNNEGFSMADLASSLIDYFFPNENEDIIKDFAELKELIAQYNNINEYLLSFAIDREKFSSFLEKNYVECEVPITDEFLRVTTIHSAKGMEWKNVIIMGMSDENFPNMWFARNMSLDGKDYYLNDRLKVMYVAATRTKGDLYMTYSVLNSNGYPQHKSRFLANI